MSVYRIDLCKKAYPDTYREISHQDKITANMFIISGFIALSIAVYMLITGALK